MFDFVPRDPLDPHELNSIQAMISAAISAVRTRLPPPPDLFHYTDPGGLKGIIESGVLRATHVAYVNDASEYLHAVQLLGAEMKRVKQTAADPAHKELLEVIESAVAPTRPQDVGPYFVACFRPKGTASISGAPTGKERADIPSALI